MSLEYTTHCNDCGHSFQYEDGDTFTCNTCGLQIFRGQLPQDTYDAILTIDRATNGGLEDHFKLVGAAWDKIIENLPPCECGGTYGDYPARCHKCHSTNVTRDEKSEMCHCYV